MAETRAVAWTTQAQLDKFKIEPGCNAVMWGEPLPHHPDIPLYAEPKREWQPIETAPQDWSDVLLFDPEYPNDHRKVFEGYFDADLECWRSADTSLRQEIFPTHWQPLPDSPTNALRQGRKEAE